jgi:hypothetical protein
MVPKGKPIANRTSRHGGRVVLSLDVEPQVRDALRERAAASGVSMAEYLTNALALPDRLHATESAAQSEVLVRISYEIARARAAVAAGENDALVSALESTRTTVADALRPLARTHAEEVRSLDRRRAGGWSG